eukprot:4818337-Pyramimonas_sp.AAC.1
MPRRQGPQGVPAPDSAHPSHVAWPHGGSSTEGPSGRVHTAYPHPIRRTPHTFQFGVHEARFVAP